MKTESTFIGARLSRYYTVTRRLGYNEAMTAGLYLLTCSYCGSEPMIWIEVDTGRWRWERMCLEVHEVRNSRVEQRLAKLLAFAA